LAARSAHSSRVLPIARIFALAASAEGRSRAVARASVALLTVASRSATMASLLSSAARSAGEYPAKTNTQANEKTRLIDRSSVGRSFALRRTALHFEANQVAGRLALILQVLDRKV